MRVPAAMFRKSDEIRVRSSPNWTRRLARRMPHSYTLLVTVSLIREYRCDKYWRHADKGPKSAQRIKLSDRSPAVKAPLSSCALAAAQSCTPKVSILFLLFREFYGLLHDAITAGNLVHLAKPSAALEPLCEFQNW